MRIKKVFMDINKEEEWLNEQGKKGLLLTSYNNGIYEFENVSHAKYQYKIDQPSYTGNKRKDYIEFLKQSGISIIADYAGRLYLCKNKAEGPLELYSEKKEINKQMKKNYIHFTIIAINQLMLAVYLLIQSIMFYKENGLTVSFWIETVFGIGFIISGIIFLIVGLKKNKKYSSYVDSENIFE